MGSVIAFGFFVFFALAFIYDEYRGKNNPFLLIKRKYQLLCADHSVSRIVGTYDTKAEVMQALTQWAHKDHAFSIREVWTK